MATRSKQQQTKGLSWELIGVAAILGIIAVGGLLILVSPKQNAGVPETPEVVTRDPAVGLDGPDMSGLDADGRPFLGSPSAPVTVYEFTDFQCPHCRDFSLFVGKAIKDDLVATGKARLVFVGYPFMDDANGENESANAAAAAHCAAAEGKFWELHDWVFTNQNTVANTGGFTLDRLRTLAIKAGLDMTAYDACITDPATVEFVQGDADLARSKSVTSTPSFLIMGQDRLYEGTDAQALDGLRKAIETAAAAASS